jgi:hypothetical protein
MYLDRRRADRILTHFRKSPTLLREYFNIHQQTFILYTHCQKKNTFLSQPKRLGDASVNLKSYLNTALRTDQVH